jgi:geranylgeranyl diphosphate synthase type I
VPAAILTGSALQSLALEVVLDPPTPTGAAAADLLGRTTRALIGGQFEDLAFERRESVTVAECLAMAAGKTGALVSCSAAVGAVLAGAPADTIAALEAYGERVGLAFQLEDDLLGIWGDPAVTGKPALADLRARKKSLPVAAALATGGPAAAGCATGWPPRHRRPTTPSTTWPSCARSPAGRGGRRPGVGGGRGPAPGGAGRAGAGRRAGRAGRRAELVALARSLLGRSA